MTSALLDALVLAYFRREVSQDSAAKLLKMRKSEFAELALGWAADLLQQAEQFEQIRRDVAWRAYLSRFLASFPDCDPRAVRRESLPTREADPLWRPPPPSPVAIYRAAKVTKLPPPQTGTGAGVAWDNRCMGWDHAPDEAPARPEQIESEAA